MVFDAYVVSHIKLCVVQPNMDIFWFIKSAQHFFFWTIERDVSGKALVKLLGIDVGAFHDVS